MNIDRFSGEALEPPIWGYCDYQGCEIYVGQKYCVVDGMVMCEECAENYEDKEVRIAEIDWWE